MGAAAGKASIWARTPQTSLFSTSAIYLPRMSRRLARQRLGTPYGERSPRGTVYQTASMRSPSPLTKATCEGLTWRSGSAHHELSIVRYTSEQDGSGSPAIRLPLLAASNVFSYAMPPGVKMSGAEITDSKRYLPSGAPPVVPSPAWNIRSPVHAMDYASCNSHR